MKFPIPDCWESFFLMFASFTVCKPSMDPAFTDQIHPFQKIHYVITAYQCNFYYR